MGNLVFTLLLLYFITNSAQFYYSPYYNDYSDYYQSFTRQQCARIYTDAVNQCVSFVTNNLDLICGQGNEYKDNYISTRKSVDIEDEATNRNMFSSYEPPMIEPSSMYADEQVYLPPMYQDQQYRYGNTYPYGAYENPPTPEIMNQKFIWNGLLQRIEKNPQNINSAKYIHNHPNWKLFDNNICGETSTDRIIGGKEAQLGQFPWLGLIGYRNSTLSPDQSIFSCGATLINSCWVITAAHCVSNLPGDYFISEIRLGEHSLSGFMDCNSIQCADPPQRFTVEKMIIHENFNNPKQKNDIALLKLNKPAKFTKWVVPICLPRLNLLLISFVDKTGELAGWGIDDMISRHTSDVLLTVKLNGKHITDCQSIYTKTNIDEESQLCFGGIAGKDSCNGDSGGPLMKVDTVMGESPKYYIFGIVSFGSKECGKNDVPAIYTKIAYFMPWILDMVSQC